MHYISYNNFSILFYFQRLSILCLFSSSQDRAIVSLLFVHFIRTRPEMIFQAGRPFTRRGPGEMQVDNCWIEEKNMETAHQLRCVKDWKWLWNLHSLQEEASSNVPGCFVSSAKAAVATGACNFLSKNTEKQWAYELETASFVLGTGAKNGVTVLGVLQNNLVPFMYCKIFSSRCWNFRN